MIKRIILIFIVCTLLTNIGFSQGLIIPYNLNFELGAVGYEPPSWDVSKTAQSLGYIFITTDSLSSSGQKSLVINSPNTIDTSTTAHIKQTLNAYNYRGRKISFSADFLVHLDNPQSYTLLWANVRNSDGDIIAAYTSNDKPITNNFWQRHEIFLDVPDNAHTISYGFALRGSGTAFIDNARFEIVQSSAIFYADTLTLSTKQIHNIISFAEVYGLIRYFLPNFYSDKIDWTNFLLYGIIAAEKSSGNIPFDIILQDILPSKSSSKTKYAWLHTGIPSFYSNAVSNSKIIDISKNQRKQTALLVQKIPISVGRIEPISIEITAECLLNSEISATYGNILARFEDDNGKILSFISLEEPFIKENTFKKYKINSQIPEKTKFIRLAINLDGDGSLIVKNLSTRIFARTLKNPRSIKFDFSKEKLIDWVLLDASKKAGYDFGYDAEFASLKLFSTNFNKILLPKNDIFSVKLKNGDIFDLPVILALDSNENERNRIKFRRELFEKPSDFVPNIKDRHSRIALLVDLWNVLVHFAISSEQRPTLDSLLEISISEVSKSSDSLLIEFYLNKMLSLLNDNNALIERYLTQSNFQLPIMLKQLDNKLIVTEALTQSKLQIGDEVLEIEGRKADDYLQNIEKYISVPNPIYKRIIAINKFLQGKPESEVNITVLRNKKQIKLTERRTILAGELIEERPSRYEIFGDSVIYCDLTRTTDKELSEISKFMQNYPVLIFDLRGQSQVSEYFLGLLAIDTVVSFPIVTKTNTFPFGEIRNDYYIFTDIKPYKKLANKKIYFLCDERSITLSETILAIAKYNKLGTIIGRPSSGSAGEICTLTLPCDYFLTATSAKIISADGKMISGCAIEPDVLINYDMDLILKGIDDILYKTLEMIKTERAK